MSLLPDLTDLSASVVPTVSVNSIDLLPTVAAEAEAHGRRHAAAPPRHVRADVRGHRQLGGRRVDGAHRQPGRGVRRLVGNAAGRVPDQGRGDLDRGRVPRPDHLHDHPRLREVASPAAVEPHADVRRHEGLRHRGEDRARSRVHGDRHQRHLDHPSACVADQPDRLGLPRGRAQEIGFETGVAQGKFFFREASSAKPSGGGGIGGAVAGAAASMAGGGPPTLTFQQNLQSFRPRRSAANIPSEVEVRVYDYEKAEVVVGTAPLKTGTAKLDDDPDPQALAGSFTGLPFPIPTLPNIPGLPSLGLMPSMKARVISEPAARLGLADDVGGRRDGQGRRRAPRQHDPRGGGNVLRQSRRAGRQEDRDRRCRRGVHR